MKIKTIFNIIAVCGLTLLALTPAQGALEWNDAASMRIPRMGHTAVAFEGKIYVFGGMTPHREMMITPLAEVYDPEENEWAELPSMPVPLYQASAVVSGRIIYIIGGTTRGGSPNDAIFTFNPRFGREEEPYHRIGHIPHPRWGFGTAKVGRKVLIIGGITGRQEYLRNGYWWEPDSERWETSPSLNQPAGGFGLAINGTLWAIGGMSFGPLNRVERFDGDDWVEMPRQMQLPEPLGELGTAFFNDTLLIAAGGIGLQGAVSDDAYALSTRSGRWMEIESLSEARAQFPLINLSGKLYAVGGGTAGLNHGGIILESVEVLSEPNAVGDELEPVLPRDFEATIWPNPTNGLIQVSLPNGVSRIRLLDPTGKLVAERSTPVNGGRWSWQFLDQPAGRYELILIDAGGLSHYAGGVILLK